jgi:hypothetical protein
VAGRSAHSSTTWGDRNILGTLTGRPVLGLADVVLDGAARRPRDIQSGDRPES